MDLKIKQDHLQGAAIIALLQRHLDYAHEVTPAESIHALDLDGLRAPDVTFWSVWSDSVLVGCGALRELDPRHAEIKSMHTAEEARRQGVGSAILDHIIGIARQRGYIRLSLETGTQEAFAPARALYRRHGFEDCGPFGDYHADPNSAYMTRILET
ncbi:MAG: GNAT family N-acetyltransferase [Alphaproteobacteria bacterium]